MNLQQLLSEQWNNDEKMVEFCLKETTYVDMGNYFLEIGHKPTIDSTIHYADTDYSTGGMAKDPGNSFEVFRGYNNRLNGPQRSLSFIEKGQTVMVGTNYYNDKTGGRIKSWSTLNHWEQPRKGQREATPEEVEVIIATLNAEQEKYEKRLKTYYKRYSDKINTNSYWAER